MTTDAQSMPREGSELLKALHDVQDRFGYVPRAEAMELSQRLGVPLARIFEVLTFYNYFLLEAPGRVSINVCLGTSCHLQGGMQLLIELEQLLGIRAGEATPDGHYHLDVVRCVGCCGCSPTLTVDGKVYNQVAPTDIPGILKAHEEGRAATGAATP